MMEKHDWEVVYRCRLCGAIYGLGHYTKDDATVQAFLHPRTTAHYCTPEQFGICDQIGARKIGNGE